jgi:hypothetical protein
MAGAGQISYRLDWDGDRALDAMRQANYEAAVASATGFMLEAKARAARKTGTMGRSGAITVNKLPDMYSIFAAAGGGVSYTGMDFLNALLPKAAPRSWQVKVYMSFNTPYSAFQHETGPNAKFLERPVRSGVPELVKNIRTANGRQLRAANRIRFGR